MLLTAVFDTLSTFWRRAATLGYLVAILSIPAQAEESQRIYANTLRLLENPRPLLADYPEYVQPILETRHFEAPPLVVDEPADLHIRAWRYSYHIRGIVEIPNRLAGAKTALIVVHPWGIDDGQGWRTPEPAGTAFGCTPEKNQLLWKHAQQVINPLLERLRPHVRLVLYSLPGNADPLRTQLYRTMHGNPTEAERAEARRKLRAVLQSHRYQGGPVPVELTLSRRHPVRDYFQQFPGLRADDHYNGTGFWQLPIPVTTALEVAEHDVVVFDEEGYPALRKFLEEHGIEHILLCGYATDLCVCSTTAGYENLRRDFNVFLVGDATQATCPANRDARYATNQAISVASLKVLITQVSWISHIR